MEVRDTKALLKAIQQAQEPVVDLFSDKATLTLDEKEKEAVAAARQAVANNQDLDYKTGNRLMSIYKRAYA